MTDMNSTDIVKAHEEDETWDSRIESAISVIEYSRQSHVNWLEEQKRLPDWKKRYRNLPAEELCGDEQHHEKCITEYNEVIAVMEKMKRNLNLYRNSFKQIQKDYNALIELVREMKPCVEYVARIHQHSLFGKQAQALLDRLEGK